MKDTARLERLLQYHDWWHDMSDDNGVYRRGREQVHAILDEVETLGLTQEEFDPIFKEYAPQAFDCAWRIT